MKLMNFRIVAIVAVSLFAFSVFAQNKPAESSVNHYEQKLELKTSNQGTPSACCKKGPGAQKGCCGMPDLSADQKKQIEVLKYKKMKETLVIKNQIGEKKARLRTLVTTDNADIKEINNVIDEISALKNKMIKTKINHRLAVRKLLTDNQKIVFDTKFDMNKFCHGKRGEGHKSFKGCDKPCGKSRHGQNNHGFPRR